MGDMFPCESRMTTPEYRKGFDDIKWELNDERQDSKGNKEDSKVSSKRGCGFGEVLLQASQENTQKGCEG